jgi:hypothetical protein
LEDFRLGTQGYDIKAAGVGEPFLNVNEAKRLRFLAEGVKILPCAFVSDNALRLYKPVSAATVGTWQLKHGRTPYRSIPLEQLTPLASLPPAKHCTPTLLDAVRTLFGGQVITHTNGGTD